MIPGSLAMMAGGRTVIGKVFEVDSGETLTNGLKAYWKLSDTADYFGSYTLTNNNSVAFVSGKVENSADFGSANSNKSLTIANNLGVDGGACSLSCWFKMTGNNTSEQQALFTASTASKVCYSIGPFASYIRYTRGRSCISDDTVIYTAALSLNTWYHAVLTYDGTNLRGYFNGTLVAGPTAYSGNGDCSGSKSGLSSDYYSERFFFWGIVDEAGVWNRALTATEVSDLYNGGAGQTMITL